MSQMKCTHMCRLAEYLLLTTQIHKDIITNWFWNSFLGIPHNCNLFSSSLDIYYPEIEFHAEVRKNYEKPGRSVMMTHCKIRQTKQREVMGGRHWFVLRMFSGLSLYDIFFSLSPDLCKDVIDERQKDWISKHSLGHMHAAIWVCFQTVICHKYVTFCYRHRY